MNKSKVTATIFAALLGVIAIDLFYLKEKSPKFSPVFVLLMGLIFGPIAMLFGFARAIGYMWMSQTAFDAKYNQEAIANELHRNTPMPRPSLSNVKALSTQLAELGELRKRGDLTESEFSAAKAELLNKKAA